jgi:hypothetical protein
MVVLGLVLLIGAAVLTTAVVTDNTGAVRSDLWGLHMSNLSIGEIFVVGILTGAVALLGIALLLAGLRRAGRRRHERRVLLAENRRLTGQVEPDIPATDTYPPRHRADTPVTDNPAGHGPPADGHHAQPTRPTAHNDPPGSTPRP